MTQLHLVVFTVCLFQTFINGQQYKECGGKPADIMFALDSSASIPFKDFQKEINFTQNLIKIFDIGSDKTRVGLVTFSTTVVPVLRVGEFETKAEILEKTNGIQFQGGNTNTAEALSYIRQKGFKATDSKDRPKIAIILTDGQSNNVVRTITEAAKAKTDGITVFVIGIGSQVDEQELEAIATKPLSHYMLKIGNFDALDSIKDELAIKACEVVPVTPAPPTEPMMNDDDVLYGEGNFLNLLKDGDRNLTVIPLVMSNISKEISETLQNQMKSSNHINTILDQYPDNYSKSVSDIKTVNGTKVITNTTIFKSKDDNSMTGMYMKEKIVGGKKAVLDNESCLIVYWQIFHKI